MSRLGYKSTLEAYEATIRGYWDYEGEYEVSRLGYKATLEGYLLIIGNH